MYKINNANIKEWAANYDGEPFDGILCDPPYELGFMGKSWDSSGIAFDTEMWADLLKLLKPGGHLLAFSGSRTYHRMAVAIEDAGFEIRDMIEWVYGSGFPKSLNIGKAVDKIQGNEREVTGIKVQPLMTNHYGKGLHNERPIKELTDTKGSSPYEGYGTALKPAHEPCVLARKPIEGTVANNVLKHGTGGLAIDKCRIPTSEQLETGRAGRNESSSFNASIGAEQPTHSARFPANLIHDGSDEVEAVFPSDNHRFFYSSKASKSERNAGLEGFEPKPATIRMNASMVRMENGVATNDRAEQSVNGNHHPTVKPLSLTKYLATLIKPPTGGRLLVPFSGSGSEMIGALQAGWEYVEGVELTEEYIPIAEARIKYWLELKESEVEQVALNV